MSIEENRIVGRLHGKVAIIAGCNYRIGEATAHRFAREGARVSLLARRVPEGQAVQQAIRDKGGEATFIRCDVNDRRSVESAIAETVATYGGVHVLFNSAGASSLNEFPAESDEVWDQVLRLNLTATFLVCRAVWPHLIAAGGGAIINMSSLAPVMDLSHALLETDPLCPSASYAVANAGIEAFTRHIAAIGVQDNIRVNCVRPGQILASRLTTSAGDHRFAPILNEVQLVEGPGCDDVANTILFLASEEARFITAEIVNVDGGRVAKL